MAVQGGTKDCRRLWIAGFLAITLSQFLTALQGNLAKLHAPAARGIGYNAIHSPGATRRATAVWTTGRIDLAPFHPLAPAKLISLHVGFDMLFVLAYWYAGRRALAALGANKAARRLLLVVAAADVVENLGELWWANDRGMRVHIATVLRYVTATKSLFIALTLVAALPALIKAVHLASRYVRGSAASARIVLAVSIGFAVVLFAGAIGSQAEDALESWLEGRWWQAVAAAAVGAAYVAVVWLNQRIPRATGVPAHAGRLLAVGGAVGAVGIVIWRTAGGTGLIVVGVALVIIGAGSLKDPNKQNQSQEGSSWKALAVGGTVPIAAVTLIQIRLLATLAVTHGHWPWAFALAVVGIGGTLAVGVRLGRDPATQPGPTVIGFKWSALLVAPFASSLALAFFAPRSLEATGAFAGTIAVMLAGLVVLASAGGALRAGFHGVACPHALKVLGFKRTPIVTLIVAVVLIAGLLDARSTDGGYHDVAEFADTVPAIAPCPSDLADLEAAVKDTPRDQVARRLCAWLGAQAAGKAGQTVPLVLVTASGGGIRAAAWTSRVLDCLFLPAPAAPAADPCGAARASGQTNRLGSVFAAGGASGGSIGIAATVAEQLSRDGRESTDWVRARLDHDFLAPTLGYAVLGEAPLSAVGLYKGDDRARVLERQWENRWKTVGASCASLRGQSIADVGFLAVESCPGIPAMTLNGTSVSDGERVNISPFDGALPNSTLAGAFSPHSHDLVDELCRGDDIRLFAAAFLSARFPLVTPSGHLGGSTTTNCDATTKQGLDVVDGGYRDNDGSSQIDELWSVLEPMLEQHDAHPGTYAKVVPVLVRIDNGEGTSAPSASVAPSGPQLLRPLRTASHLVLDRGAEYHDRLVEDLLTFPGAGDFEFKLAEHPGRRLPLGWVLSERAMDDVNAQFELTATRARAQSFDAEFR